jgi:HSP20 family protein
MANLRSLAPFRGNAGVPGAGLFGSLQREVDRLFDEFTRGVGGLPAQGDGQLVPRMDVSETDNQIEVTVEMPGLRREDVDISLDDNILSIRGEKKLEREEDDKNRNFHVVERGYGVFYRAIQLPPGVDPSQIQATMANGVLRVTIPKPANAEAKKIEVKDEPQQKQQAKQAA